jgi:hypothetical protein
MKLIAFTLIFSLPAFAKTPQDCVQIADKIDRKYCVDKHIQSVKKQHDTEKQSWATGLTADAKAAKIKTLKTEIEQKSEHMKLLQAEIGLSTEQLKSVEAVTVKAAAAPKKKKKKKNLSVLSFNDS